MRKLLLATAVACLASSAWAADLPTKAPTSVPYLTQQCTIQSCSGLYVGADILESGSSFNLVSTGLSGIAQNDFAMGGHAGYQFWNGQWFAAVEGGGDYGIVQNGQIPGGGNSGLWDAYGLTKLGYSLSSIFGAAATSTATPTLPQQLMSSLMSPYVILGVWDRPWGAGFASGAGVEALLANNWTLDVDYIYVAYNNANVNPNVNQQSENIVRGTIDYHF